MTKSIFITATGTDVGKTYICGLLVKKLREFGLNCGYYKPVLSGLEDINGKLVAGDCKHVLKTAGIEIDPMQCVTFAFKQAVSPHLAAKMENQTISVARIIDDFNRIKQNYDYLITEGAGGIICPFKMDDEKILLPDVIKALGLEVVIVAPSGLGSINYAVLTVEYARQHSIDVKGIILNNYEENNFMHIDNKKCIEELTGVKVIATVSKGDKDIMIERADLLGIFKEI